MNLTIAPRDGAIGREHEIRGLELGEADGDAAPLSLPWITGLSLVFVPLADGRFQSPVK
jgi:hypothetical protein